jgi:Putative transposase DNA-binding domain
MTLKKAITDLKLSAANPGKLHALEALAIEHQRVVQAYIDWLIEHEMREPDKYADVPATDVPTQLSARWQRCAWQQACGIVQSWSSNESTTPPLLKNLCLQANANVVKLEKSNTPTFDFWLRISTLDSGHPVRVPLTLYRRAKQTLEKYPKLCSGVTLNKREGVWYATLVVERPNQKLKATGEVVGVDIGMTHLAVTSAGQVYGEISDALARRVEKKVARFARKQKLNACLKCKDLPTVRLTDPKAESFVRNEIGRALNQLVGDLPPGAPVALERLNVKDMRFKSRLLNRRLRASQLGYSRDKLKFKLDEQGIRYRSVQPAYSSQQCQPCGFVHEDNRRSQSRFECLNCGHFENADVNAARNIAKRFDDDELNQLPFRDVKALLQTRFANRPSPDARSASADLDTLRKGNAECPQRSIRSVLTPVSYLSMKQGTIIPILPQPLYR